MAVKAPVDEQAPVQPNSDSVSAPNEPDQETQQPRSPFAKLSELNVKATKPDAFDSLRALEGREIVFLSLDAANGKTGSALVAPVDTMEQTETGIKHKDGTSPITIMLPRGSLRVLAAGLSKLEGTGQFLTATPVKQKRGMRFE